MLLLSLRSRFFSLFPPHTHAHTCTHAVRACCVHVALVAAFGTSDPDAVPVLLNSTPHTDTHAHTHTHTHTRHTTHDTRHTTHTRTRTHTYTYTLHSHRGLRCCASCMVLPLCRSRRMSTSLGGNVIPSLAMVFSAGHPKATLTLDQYFASSSTFMDT